MNGLTRLATTSILGAILSRAGEAAAQTSLAELDRYVERVLGEWKQVGAAVAVVRGSEVIYARGFGLREIGKPAPITKETLFQIGSTSKAFTTAALGILVGEGKIRWDDRVVDHLPAFQLQDPWLTRHLTIRDAVTHRSGVADNYYPYLAIMSRDEVVRQLRYLPPDAEFRDSFHYNNLMYAAAGKVIEAASGLTWDDFIKRRLLEPLEMTRSGTSAYQYWDSQYVAPTFYGSAPGGRVSADRARDSNVAMPHGVGENGSTEVLPWVSFDSPAPAGSIVASIAGMANWLVLQLNEGQFAGRQLLTPEVMRELHTTQNRRVAGKPFPLDTVEGYAMGWFIGRYRDKTHLAHGGGMLGFPAYVAMLPEQKLGVVVLSNGPVVITDDYKFHRSIAFWALDRLLGAPARDWSKELMTLMQGEQEALHHRADELRQSRLPNVAPSAPLDRYAGDYEDSKVHSGRVTVRLENGRLVLRFAGEGAFTGYLEHWHGDQFQLHSNAGGYDFIGPDFTNFVIDPAGTAASMTIGSPYFKLTLDRVQR